MAGAKQHARGASNGKVNTEDVREVLRTLNATTGGSFRWKSPRGGETHGAKLIRAWLRHGYRVEDLERVIHSQHAAWSGRPEMAGNLRPDVLFGAKFEDYLDAPSGEAT